MEIRQLAKVEHRKVAYLVLKKGTYYIGDICYALGEEVYYQGWGDRFNFENGLYDVDGKYFAVLSTAWGDGEYTGVDNTGKHSKFPVDAGVIGMVDIGLIEKFNPSEAEEYGTLVTFDNGVAFSYNDGVIEVASHKYHLCINTEDDLSDDDDDYDMDEDWNDYDFEEDGE